MSANWRETLFVWDGILSDDEDETKEGDDGSNIGLKWEGTWVGCESADAVAVEAPKRGAFERDVTSAYSFTASCTASQKDPANNFYRVSMIGSYDLGDDDEKNSTLTMSMICTFLFSAGLETSSTKLTI